MKNYQEQVLDVINEAVRLAGSQNQLAEAMGTNRAKICKWISGTSPTTKDFAALADYVGAQIVLPNQSTRDYARFLQVQDMDAFNHTTALRRGENVPQSVLEYVAQKKHREPGVLFSLDLLEHIGIDAADALLFKAESESMAPVIKSGDLALIDKTKTAIDDGKIYLVYTSDYFLLRRISRDLGGSIILHTDNNTPPLNVPPESRDQITIMGQVVWVGHKL